LNEFQGRARAAAAETPAPPLPCTYLLRERTVGHSGKLKSGRIVHEASAPQNCGPGPFVDGPSLSPTATGSSATGRVSFLPIDVGRDTGVPVRAQHGPTVVQKPNSPKEHRRQATHKHVPRTANPIFCLGVRSQRAGLPMIRSTHDACSRPLRAATRPARRPPTSVAGTFLRSGRRVRFKTQQREKSTHPSSKRAVQICRFTAIRTAPQHPEPRPSPFGPNGKYAGVRPHMGSGPPGRAGRSSGWVWSHWLPSDRAGP